MEATKYDEACDDPICEKCNIPMKWVGTFRIGLYEGGIAAFECQTCKAMGEAKIVPNEFAKQKSKEQKEWIMNYRKENGL